MKKLIIGFSLLVFALPLFGDTIHVPGDYSTIQGAINGALDGDTILVGPGTYVENLNIDRALELQSSAGPETTVIDGNQAGSVVYAASGPLVIIDGFTITNGLNHFSGGIHCTDAVAEITIRNNIIDDNETSAFYSGGGIGSFYCPLVTIENNIITNNRAKEGGGICCFGIDECTVSIKNNLISENKTPSIGIGAGICTYSVRYVEISNNVIKNNAVLDMVNPGTGYGGGIAVNSGFDILIENNTIEANIAANGGGIYTSSIVDLAINNCTFIDNVSSSGGGGLYQILCTGSIENCLFAKNESINVEGGAYGAALSMAEGCNISLNNVTIAENTTDPNEYWSFIYIDTSCNVDFTNSIIVYNHYLLDVPPPGSSVTFNYCNSEWDLSGYGSNNICEYPLFVDPVNYDYRLQQDPCQTGVVNPCVDAGDPSSAMIEGSTRTDGLQDQSIVDLGYHYPIPDWPVKKVPSEFSTIQEAIDYSGEGDLILVAPDTYFENIVYPGHAIEVRSDGDGDSETLDIAPAQTVIDGSQLGSVVEFTSGNGPGSVLNGFTLTNGSGKSVLNEYLGGGVYCKNASPIIQNNIITENTIAPGWLLFGFGGGIYCDASSPSILNNTISYNYVENGGGGIYCKELSQPAITHNTILGNSAESRGGGIYCTGASTPAITNNIIAENLADTRGGGLYCIDGSTPTDMTCNTITGNSAGSRGGGFYMNEGVSPNITNTILWDNTAPEGPEIWIGDLKTACLVTIDFSDVKDGLASIYVEPGSTLTWGTEIMDMDPLFEDPVTSDYHLSLASPCIDAGDNGAAGMPGTDIDGQGRLIPFVRRYLMGQPVSPGIVDMGADEYWGARIHQTPNNPYNQ